MAITTPNMALTAWISLTDPYSNSQLAANFTAIDSHNHTSGAGAPIITASIAANAITNPLINPGSIQGSAGPNTTNIYPASITSTELAAGSVGSTQLTAGAVSSAVPIGTITAWFRPATSVAFPTNWHVCDGTTLGPSQHNFPGGGNVTLPNLLNRFILGCQPGGTGDNGPSVAPGENVTGGSNAQNLTHTHTIPGHSHPMDHSHTLASHSHTISADGSHNHTFAGGFNFHIRPNTFQAGLLMFDNFGVLYGNSLDSTYVGPYAGIDTAILMDNAGSHAHTGVTGNSGTLTTGGASPNSTSLTFLDSQNPDQALPTDFRPQYEGLIYICKVM